MKYNDEIEVRRPIKSYEQKKIETVEDGQVVTKYVIEEIDCATVNEGLTCADMSLSSLINAGATELLQPNGTISRGSLSVADSVELGATKISESIKNNE